MPLSDRWTIAPAFAAGQPFQAVDFVRSLRIDSNSCWVVMPQYGIVVPPGVIGHILNLPRATQDIEINTVTPTGQTGGTGTTAAIVTGYARWQTQSPGLLTNAFGGPGSGPISVNTTPVKWANSGIGNATAGAVAQLAPVRANARSILIKNEDTSNAIRVGPTAAGISSTVGLYVGPLDFASISDSSRIDFAAVAGTPAVSFYDVWM